MKFKVSDFSWMNVGWIFLFGAVLTLFYNLFVAHASGFMINLFGMIDGGLLVGLNAIVVIALGNYVKGLKWLDKVPAFIIGSAVLSGFLRVLFNWMLMMKSLVTFAGMIQSFIAQVIITLIVLIAVHWINMYQRK